MAQEIDQYGNVVERSFIGLKDLFVKVVLQEASDAAPYFDNAYASVMVSNSLNKAYIFTEGDMATFEGDLHFRVALESATCFREQF